MSKDDETIDVTVDIDDVVNVAQAILTKYKAFDEVLEACRVRINELLELNRKQQLRLADKSAKISELEQEMYNVKMTNKALVGKLHLRTQEFIDLRTKYERGERRDTMETAVEEPGRVYNVPTYWKDIK